MTTNIQQPKKRIEYIDALRGMTMILVVFSHVEMSTFDFNTPTFINDLFMSFRMPLFFFISGFIAYKANVVWNKQTWWQMSRKKLLVQLIPTFIFGLIHAYAYQGVDFREFITNDHKLGYWFTIALLEIFLIVYTTNTLLYSADHNKHKKRMLVALVLLSAVLYVLRFALKMVPSLNEVGNILSLHRTVNYFQYFAFGYICSMYRDVFTRVLDKKYTMAIVITLFVGLFYAKRFYISVHIGNSFDMWKIVETLIETLIGYFGLLVVYNTFKIYEGSFTTNTKVGRALQFIGKRTLDVYLLHYFLIPYLPQVGKVLQESHNAALEITIGLLLSLIVVGLCLVISGILRTSPVLAKYLFGVSKKK